MRNPYHSSPDAVRSRWAGYHAPPPCTATAIDTPSTRWYALPLLLLGVIGFAAAWILVALEYDRLLPWLAPLAAADMVLLLAIARWPAGTARALAATASTIATIGCADFGIIAAQLGRGMGLLPWESAARLGPDYAWEVARLAITPSDLAWYAIALVVAGWAGFSARRRAPSAR